MGMASHVGSLAWPWKNSLFDKMTDWLVGQLAVAALVVVAVVPVFMPGLAQHFPHDFIQRSAIVSELSQLTLYIPKAKSPHVIGVPDLVFVKPVLVTSVHAPHAPHVTGQYFWTFSERSLPVQ